jgi:hypothetical protein
MLFAVDLTIMAEKTVIVEARSKSDAARKARAKETYKKQLLEEGDYVVLCSTSRVRELRESEK